MLSVTKRTGRQKHPEGGVIDLTPEERARFKKRREDLKLTHRSLAKKIGASSGTISNIETGRYGQTSRVHYAAAYVVLFGGDVRANVEGDVWKRLIGALVLNPEMWPGVTAMVEEMTKQKPTK